MTQHMKYPLLKVNASSFAEQKVVLPKRRVVLPKRSGFRRGDPKKKKAGITVSRRKANCSGLEMTKDRNAEENRASIP